MIKAVLNGQTYVLCGKDPVSVWKASYAPKDVTCKACVNRIGSLGMVKK